MKQFVLLIFLVLSSAIHSQQLAHITQWSQHQYAINPAFTGIKTCMEVQSTIRGQWMNLSGAPITGFLTLNAPLKAKRAKFYAARHGMGGLVSYDQIGPFQTFQVQLSYAGHFNFTIDNRLSLGLAVGAKQLAFDINKAMPLNPDPVINGSATQILPTATFGAWWNGKNYFIGFSAYELIPQKWNVIGTDARSRMHAMINAGYKMQVNPKFTFFPAIYVGFVANAPVDLQIQALGEFQRKWWIGLGFRNTDALIGMVGFRFYEKWKLGYSYDFILSKLRPGTFHTHELTLSFSPCKQRIDQQAACPVFE
jgi:type IX secretion system PorP/SprF family membrane protein